MALLSELKDQNTIIDNKIKENEEKMDSYESHYPWLMEKKSRKNFQKMIVSGFLTAGGIGLLVLSLMIQDQGISIIGLILLLIGLLLSFIFNRKNIKDRIIEREYTALFHQQDDLLIQKNTLNDRFSLAVGEKSKDTLELKKNLEDWIYKIQEDLNKIDRVRSNPLLVDTKDQMKNLERDEARFELLLDQLEEKKKYLKTIEKKRIGLQEKRDQLLEEKEAIEISRDILTKLLKNGSSTFQDDFYKQANLYLETLSEEDYSNLSYEKDLGYYLYKTNKDYNIHQNMLSRSSMEILYLSLRLAMMDMQGNKEIPLLLDDAFVHFDKNRRRRVVGVLNKLDRQVLFFSKDPLGSDNSNKIIALNK